MTKLVNISNQGRIRYSHNGFITSGVKLKTGYRKVSIRRKNYYVHRLVGFAFLPPRKNLTLTIDHIDGNRSNNRAINLEWATMAEQNRRKSLRAKLLGAKRNVGSSNSRRILVKKKKENEWISYASLRELKRVLKMDGDKVAARLRGEKQQYYPEYEFKDDPYEVALLDGETWLPIVLEGKETKCQVSDFGRVKNKRNIFSHGVKQDNGYMYSTIENYGSKLVHLLVAAAFLPTRPSPTHTIDHIDGDTMNNRCTNLEWVTKSEQLLRHHALKRAKGIDTVRLDRIQIEGAIQGTNNWERFDGIGNAARILGIHKQAITICLKNPKRTADGRIFRFFDMESQRPLLDETWKTIDLEQFAIFSRTLKTDDSLDN